MSDDVFTIMAIAAAAGFASPAGGLVALWRAPTSLFMSVSLGFASGVVIDDEPEMALFVALLPVSFHESEKFRPCR
jgi:hypothetical protein